jgi:hypothetical protein
MSYFPEEYSFTKEEFKEVFMYLDNTYAEKYAEEIPGMFYESKMYFIYGDRRFIWRLMVGQGSSLQFILEDSTSDNWKFKEDKAIVLEKL